MEAVAWSAIGLLAATLIATIFWLGTRIDGLGASLGARIDAQSTRIDGLSSRVDGLSGEVARLASRLDDHIGRHAG